MFRRFRITGLVVLVGLMALAAYHEANSEPPSLAFPQTRAERRQAEARAFCAWRLGIKEQNLLTLQDFSDFAQCLAAQR